MEEKNKITASIIADSINPQGNRITSFVVQFPRIVLAELNTHRALSRNSASSRAVPFEKMLKRVKEEPFIPMAWQKDHKGMQGTEYETNNLELFHNKAYWLEARDRAIESAKMLNNAQGVTKQLCNRLLEPFMYHTAIVTATELENFFYLRCPQYYTFDKNGKKITGFRSKKDVINYHRGLTMETEYDTIQWLKVNEGKGEIHIMALAEAMWDAFNESTPKELKQGEWHIPFGDRIDKDRIYSLWHQETDGSIGQKEFDEIRVKIATARCARVSYINYEGKDDYEADIKLHDNLSKAGHWSCFEHCAQAMDIGEYDSPSRNWSGNFKGFIQYRKMFNNENKTK